MTGLLAGLEQLTGIGTDLLWAGLVVFLRIGAILSLAPAFGEQVVPMRVRLAVALAFTLVLAPAVMAVQDLGLLGLVGLGAEVPVGLMLGIGLRLFVLALQMAGAMAAQATSLAQMFGGAGPEPQPALGNLLVMAGLALAVALDLHVRLAEFFLLSYQIFPPGLLPAPGDATPWGVAQVARAFRLAFSLAAPFTIAALLYNLALGAINRAMPALMVSFIGAPVLIALGFVLMILALPLLLGLWGQALQGFLASPQPVPP